MDECHHAGAATVEQVLNEVNANHVYGFTATPKREDGQEQKIFMQFGKIRYRYTALDRARAQGIEHYILPRFTHFVVAECEKIKIQDAYKAIVNSDIRNKQIIADTKECIENGRTPLVLTKYKEHANVLFDKMKKMADHVFLLQGGGKSKEKEIIRAQMKNVPENETVILIAIGKYIGEGFNYPRLDTLLLAMPISWQGNVEQYAGRLHRDYATKKDVIIYDYVDAHVKVLEKMYHKRVQTYKKIGYKIISKVQTEIEEDCFIYGSDNYWQNYERDITNARQEIIISSPGLGTVAVNKTIRLLEKAQENGVAIKVITLPSEQYSVMQINRVQNLITLLRKANIDVKEKPLIHEHYAIIDQKIVWYGSMNLLSRNKPDDNLMRLNNEEVAQELMLLTFGN
jgi:superfamily II DNA or RNA helicase